MKGYATAAVTSQVRITRRLAYLLKIRTFIAEQPLIASIPLAELVDDALLESEIVLLELEQANPGRALFDFCYTSNDLKRANDLAYALVGEVGDVELTQDPDGFPDYLTLTGRSKVLDLSAPGAIPDWVRRMCAIGLEFDCQFDAIVGLAIP